ncbi:MAG: type II secretion system F family protein [Chloroflexi bacterium]|nr:type II secretion system F family protein [Chloroflexota bacterium]
MDALTIVIPAIVLVSVLLIVFGLRSGAPAPARDMESRLRAFTGEADVDRGKGQEDSKDKGKESKLKQQRSYSGLPILSAFLAQFSGSEKIALDLERAGVPLRVGEYYMIRWGVGGVFLLVPFAFGISLFQIGISVALGIVGYMLPSMWLSNKRNGRKSRIDAQLVDMLGLVSNSLKSGYGLMQSFEFASKQMNPPLAVELRRMLRDANLGMSAEDALTAMGERIDSPDLDMVLTAVNIQRAVGGNLAEILDKVAFTMRERERIRGEIATLTSQQRMTGIVIGGLPVFMFALFMVLNPDYMSLLFTETAGRLILVTAIGLEVLGYLVIKKIMAIEI